MAQRFIFTSEGDNLSSVSRRLFPVEGGRRLTELRRRLLELNPHLPERRNIPAGAIVFVPEEFDGERPRERGRTFDQVTGGVLEGFRQAVDRLSEELDREIDAENVRHEAENAALRDRGLRRLVQNNPGLQRRLERIAAARGERMESTERLKRLRERGLDEIRQDLDTIAALGGNVPIG